MCGIVGIVPRQASDPEQLDALVRRMAAAIVHRGPDEDGFHVTPRVALGIRRLSIIDVTGSRQPIRSADGRQTIVFNGEIYNFRTLRRELAAAGHPFHTVGDTEVALRAFEAWGVDCFRRFEGMFGLAIWDESRRTLTLARDCMGQKPLYHAETGLGWVFASEIKALLASGLVRPELDLEALSHFMTLRCHPTHRTLFRGVSKLPAAHRAEVSADKREMRRFWQPEYEPKHGGDERQVIERLDATLAEVVAEHLVSDVPIGAFLSGGIDSSLVVAYAATASETPLSTFAIGVDQASQNELPWARQVAERYHTRHTERIIDPDLAQAAPRMTATLEEPVDPFAAGVYLVSASTSEQVTVALGGDGGDELFAGYDRYVGQQLAQLYAALPAPIRRGVLRPILRRFPESFGYKSLATRLRWLDRMADLDGVERYAESAAFLRFPHALKAELFAPRHWRDLEAAASEKLLEPYFDASNASAFLDRMLHADCSTRLAEHQLPIVDRMSMAHGLEVRSPFLDRRVAELAMRIPARWKLRHRRLKYMTRKLGERYLPKELLYRKKQGFGFPLGLWFRGDLRRMICTLPDESRLVEAGIFDRGPFRRLVSEHVDGAIDHNYRLWLLFGTELWYRHFIEGQSVGELEDWVARSRCRTENSSAPSPITTMSTTR